MKLFETTAPLSFMKFNPVADATDAMSLQELQTGSRELSNRIAFLLEQMQSGNINNITLITELLDIQNAKLAQYEGKILQKEAAGNVTIDPVTGQPIKQDPELPPATKKPNWLLYGVIAGAVLFFIKRRNA